MIDTSRSRVLIDVTTDMVITKEETLGQGAPLYRFETHAEAIKMANDTPHPNPPPLAGEGREGPAIPASAALAGVFAIRWRFRHNRGPGIR